MAVAVTAMQLENDLKLVEDDLSSFIQSQKNSLLKEKLQLKKNKPRRAERENEDLSLIGNNNNLPMPAKKNTDDVVDAEGLNLGGYENVQQQLRNERQKEYKQYLEQQAKMRGKRLIDTDSRNSDQVVAQRYENRKEYKSNIDKEYGDLVRNKKNEETLYNHHYGVDDNIVNARQNGRKVIEFNDSDDELFNYVLQEKAKIKQMSTPERAKHGYPEDGRSSSVPPPNVPDIFEGGNRNNMRNVERRKSFEKVNGNQVISTRNAPTIFGGSRHSALKKERNIEYKHALEDQMKEKLILKSALNSHSASAGLSPPEKVPYVFGGNSHSNLRKQNNLKYKQALEQQIKEKQTEKTKERLKRLGRLTSTDDMNIGNNNVLLKDQVNQYSEQNMIEDSNEKEVPYSHANMENMPMGYPNQNNYPMNPMFNPMMNYPVGWPTYGAMLPNGFVPGNMMGFQQMPVNMQHVNNGRHSKMVDQNGMVERYVPSAMGDTVNPTSKGNSTQLPPVPTDTSRKYNQQNVKSSGRNSGLVANIAIGESPQIPDMNAKRAQQIAYQQELKQQMDVKKAAAEKDKKEREKYEMKLEREIAKYDPWGKSGCGAPVRNKDGAVMADLKKVLHTKDDGVEASFDGKAVPDKLPEDLSPMLRALELTENVQTVSDDNAVDMKNDGSPSYGRGAALKELQGMTVKSPRDQIEQTSYKQYLAQQVEEKKKKEEELKEKARLEEEKENKRLSEQQHRMREEYEQEKEKQRRKAEEIRKQNEELSRLAEQKKLDEEMKRKKIDDDRDADRKKEAIAKLKLAQHQETSKEIDSPPRSHSPPVPAVMKTRRKSSVHTIHKEDNTHSDSEETMNYLDTIRNSLNKRKEKDLHKIRDRQDQKDLIRQLSALRKQLMRKEVKVQDELQRNKTKYSNLVSENDWNDQPKVQKRSAFDRATSVTSGRKRHPMKANEEFQQNYDGDFVNAQKDLDTQQQEYMRQQEMRLAALRQGVKNKTLPTELKINRQVSKQSLLESDSTFISIDNHQEVRNIKYINGNTENTDNDNFSLKAPSDVDIGDTVSISTLQVEDISRKNDERLANLNSRGNTTQRAKERLKLLEEDTVSNENTDTENIIEDFMQKQYEVR